MHDDYLTRADLKAQGYTRRSITSAVRRGALLHVRRDRYLPHGALDDAARAVRVGGRLTCLSLLKHLGVFVLENRRLHVHVHPNASRLRAPFERRRRLGAIDKVQLHWTRLVETPSSTCTVHIVDALAHAVRCQPIRAAVATLDSALHKGLLAPEQLHDVFHALPPRFHAMLPFVDGRAESGPETIVRMMARQLGCDVVPQVTFLGIGRVDLLVDGWLVVECDSKEFHAEWEQQVEDRERDLALAARGYATLRLTAAMIMYRPDEVFEALRGLVQSRDTMRR